MLTGETGRAAAVYIIPARAERRAESGVVRAKAGSPAWGWANGLQRVGRARFPFQLRASSIAASNVMSLELADGHLIEVAQTSYCAAKSRP